MADREEVARVLADDSVYIPINGEKCKDSIGIADSLLQETKAFVLMPKEGFVAIFLPHFRGLYDGHVATLPELRGKEAIRLGKSAIKWMFDNTDCIKIFGFTPVCWKHVVKFNRLLGFRQVGILKKSVLIDGQKIDQVIFEL